MSEPHGGARAAALRLAFDRSFALPGAAAPAGDAYLAIRADRRPYALPLAGCGAVLRCPPLTPCPTAVRSWLGVAAVRGALVAVYSLEELLHGPRPERGPPPWLVRSALDASAAFAFGELEGYLRSAAPPLADAAAERGPWRGQRLPGEAARGVVNLTALVRELGSGAQSPAAGVEG